MAAVFHSHRWTDSEKGIRRFLCCILVIQYVLLHECYGFSNAGVNFHLKPNKREQFKLYSSSLWRNSGNVDILLPDESDYPLGIIHFVGGAVVGAAPKTSYRLFLEGLSEAGFLVLATRTQVNEFNHQEAACEAARLFRVAYRDVEDYYGVRTTARIPVFGMGHSLGAKIQTLISSYPEVHSVARPRKANVLLSFNNFSAKESVPMLTELGKFGQKLDGMQDRVNQVTEAVRQAREVAPFLEQGLSMAATLTPKIFDAVNLAFSDLPEDFTPNTEETWRLVEDSYSVKQNMLIQFRNDNIDQSPYLAQLLEKKFGLQGDLHFARLDGSHVTPNTQDLEETANQLFEKNSNLNSDWLGDVTQKVGNSAMLELDELVRTVVYYLRAQSIWDREETDALPWDSDAV